MRPLLLATLALALLPAAAGAKTVSAERDGVTAVLDYTRDKNGGYVANELTIARNGTVLFDAKPEPEACDGFACWPTVGFGRTIKPLRIVDYEGDGESEVLFTAYTGGAHCCIVGQVFSLSEDQTGYTAVDHNFGDSGFRLRDLGKDGTLESVSNDWRFDYAFTAYAFQGKPIQIFRFEGGEFVDVTGSFLGLVRRDARVYFRRYKKIRARRDGTALGQISAWAADRYRLGKRDATLRFLHREARRGYLRGPGKVKGRRFVSELDGFLLRLGYSP
jgi:hypothetical protein